MKITKKKQLKEDIRYLIDDKNLDDITIGKVLREAEKVGVNCQYFIEEFLVA